MTAQSQLDRYLSLFRERFTRLIVARAAAVLAVIALAVTLVAVYFGMRRAFDAEFIIGARSVLLVGLVAAAIALLVLPLRRLDKSRGIGDLERRAPEFDGRLETYDGLTRQASRSPFLGLLAEDAMQLARRIPLTLKVPQLQINAPAVVAVLAGVLLVGVGAVGPDNWRYGVRHLWAGWLLDDTLPPQRIAVEPGDGAVRRGGDFLVAARAEGFTPTAMTLYAQLRADGQWQSTLMDETRDGGFEFTFFAVREPARYYVEAAGIRTPQYTVDVVDLPAITNIKLTYEYPDWTKREPLTEDPGYDILAVAGTRVTVEVETDRPLETAALEANGDRIPMTIAGTRSTASLEVSEEGEYHVSTLFGDDSVRLSDDYYISIVEDEEPVVEVSRPGRDYRASNIEEVSVRIEATDDFGLDRVELKYSINGGEWETVPIESDGTSASGDRVLYLEDMTKPIVARASRSRGLRADSPLTIEGLRTLREQAEREREAREAAESDTDEPAPTTQGLEPGDLISYYVVAEDREREVESDLFFIEVQPFDRRFTQATAGGGGGGGGGGQQQDEISRRQKEILVATWNLIREQTEDASFLDEQQLNDNALMLAELQRTLAEQARTLASRTRARQLTNADERIAEFVESLELAAESMDPAAEQLAEVELNEAVAPEQAALQHLLRAESLFSDIQVSFQQNGGGGGGGFAGRDLSELFELEMDLEKNQYETEAPVALEQESAEQDVDEAIAKLQELARRQENLARQAARRDNLTERERWQQEQLRRETEQLRRELEQLQQRLAQAQQQQQQQGGQQGEQQSGQSQGQSGQSAQNAGGQPQNGQAGGQGGISERTLRDLDNALQAMNRAAQAGTDIDPEQARRAIEQARRELDQVLEQMTAQRQQEAEAEFSDIAERAGELYANQRQVAADLQRALSEAGQQPGDSFRRGALPRDEAIELSERKLEMHRELQALEQDIQRVAQAFRSRTPGASETLSDSLAELQQQQAAVRLQYGGEAIRQGAAQQVAATEAVTTAALRDLERSAVEALEQARVEAVEGEGREPNPNAELVAEIQALRRELASIAEQQGQGGQQGQDGQQPGQGQPGEEGQPGQQGQQNGQPGAQAGGQLGGNESGGDRFGGFGGDRFGPRGFYDPNRIGAWNPYYGGAWRNPEDVDRLREQLSEAGRELLTRTTRLRGEGVSEEELRAVRELGEALRGSLGGNPELIAQEFQNLVNLAEQLELRLRAGDAGAESAIRAEAPGQSTPGYEEQVAEYYRRLSRTRDR